MGRVYDALKRAAETNGHAKPDRSAAPDAQSGNGRETDGGVIPVSSAAGDRQTPPDDAPDILLSRATPAFIAPDANPSATAYSSVSTEHTDVAQAGSALSGGRASRVAGATVGADGSTRAVAFPSLAVATARVEPHLIAITDPNSPHAEQYRSLRTRVLHAGERRKVQSIVITSAGVMEGKTLTSLNLCWLLAQTDGVRALLIDGDLRQPCAARYLGLDAPRGLSEVLAGEATLAETIVRLEPSGLHLLPGGTRRENVAEILSGPKFSATLAELRRLFDYIIIDAPPLGIFTDASVLINRADGALLVVRSGQTRYAAIERVLEPLPRERILGVVLNGAMEQPNESSYYYQRRYYRRDLAEAPAPAAANAVEETEVF